MLKRVVFLVALSIFMSSNVLSQLNESQLEQFWNEGRKTAETCRSTIENQWKQHLDEAQNVEHFQEKSKRNNEGSDAAKVSDFKMLNSVELSRLSIAQQKAYKQRLESEKSKAKKLLDKSEREAKSIALQKQECVKQEIAARIELLPIESPMFSTPIISHDYPVGKIGKLGFQDLQYYWDDPAVATEIRFEKSISHKPVWTFAPLCKIRFTEITPFVFTFMGVQDKYAIAELGDNRLYFLGLPHENLASGDRFSVESVVIVEPPIGDYKRYKVIRKLNPSETEQLATYLRNKLAQLRKELTVVPSENVEDTKK